MGFGYRQSPYRKIKIRNTNVEDLLQVLNAGMRRISSFKASRPRILAVTHLTGHETIKWHAGATRQRAVHKVSYIDNTRYPKAHESLKRSGRAYSSTRKAALKRI